jgi:hypothetical protein
MKRLLLYILLCLPVVVFAQDSIPLTFNSTSNKFLNIGVGISMGWRDDITDITLVEFNRDPESAFIFFPDLLLSTVNSKFHFQTIGFGFKKAAYKYEYSLVQVGDIFGFPTQARYFNFFYQYDFPLIKDISASSLIYSGLNISANYQEKKTNSGYSMNAGAPMWHHVYETLYTKTRNLSLNLPLGFKKQIRHSGVWINGGVQLNLIKYKLLEYQLSQSKRYQYQIHSNLNSDTIFHDSDKNYYMGPFSKHSNNWVYFQLIYFPKYMKSAYKRNGMGSKDLSTIHDNANTLKRHSVYFELGGTSLLYSFKYDYLMKQWNRLSINYGLGFSFLPKEKNYIANGRQITLPMQLSGLYGKNKSKLELGVFMTPLISIPPKKEGYYEQTKGKRHANFFGTSVGYRFQKKEGGLFFRTYFLAIYFADGFDKNNRIIYSFLPWGGIGIGFTFK